MQAVATRRIKDELEGGGAGLSTNPLVLLDLEYHNFSYADARLCRMVTQGELDFKCLVTGKDWTGEKEDVDSLTR